MTSSGGVTPYLAVDAAVAAQAVRQAGVDPGVTGQAGELVKAAGLEGERRVHAQLLVRVVAALVHGVTAPPVGDALPVGAVELVHVAAGRLRFTCDRTRPHGVTRAAVSCSRPQKLHAPVT